MSDAAIVYVNAEGRAVYRASGLYNCTTVLVAARLGIPGGDVPKLMQERFDAGHAYEPVILERVRTSGPSSIHSLQAETRQNVGSSAAVVGHIDCIAAGPVFATTVDGKKHGKLWEPECGYTVVDAKSFAPSTWKTWEAKGFDAFPYYAWQQAIYSKFFEDCPIGMAVGLKDMDSPEPRLVDYRMDVYTKPPVGYGKIVARVLEIEKLAALGMDGLPAKCDRPTYPCPYYAYSFHTEADAARIIKPADIEGGVEALTAIAEKRAAAYKAHKALEVEMEQYDAEMKSMVGDSVGQVKLSKVSDTVSSVSFSHSSYSSVDWAAMQVDFPGLDRDKYKQNKESEKLTVRVNSKRPVGKVNADVFVE